MRHKKSLFLYFLFVSMLGGIVSCNKDDDSLLSGKPVRITCSNSTVVSFSYQADRLQRITENASGSTIEFTYEGSELSALLISPTDPEIADGNGYSRFERTGERKIIAESGGDPAGHVFVVKEIELDANLFPVSITETGVYSIGEGGVQTKIKEGEYSTRYTWDTSAKQLLKEEICCIETGEVVATYAYRYDSAPGVMSRIDCPIWLHTYRNYGNHSLVFGTYRALF
ncbi:MAG: hypothetical protein LBP25_03280, partial [Tannerellaceae bacterium]|nr:hypothetical protein [Tannerellaceae bacterium]